VTSACRALAFSTIQHLCGDGPHEHRALGARRSAMRGAAQGEPGHARKGQGQMMLKHARAPERPSYRSAVTGPRLPGRRQRTAAAGGGADGGSGLPLRVTATVAVAG
jgi:hypothetical protein